MIENSQILEYIGETKTKKLIQEIQNEYFETVAKNFPTKTNPIQNIIANALVTVSDKDDDEIKGIGMSCIDDLINDNFANFWGSILSRASFQILVDQVGVGRNLRMYGNADTFLDTNGGNGSHALGCQFAIGSGVTPPTRTDFKIQTAIQTEFSPVGNMGYNSGLGQGTVTGNSPVLIGSGVISESVIYGRWFVPNQTFLFCLSRDLISPAVSFVNGQVATLEYTFQL
jgi:hypothetical protein